MFVEGKFYTQCFWNWKINGSYLFPDFSRGFKFVDDHKTDFVLGGGITNCEI